MVRIIVFLITLSCLTAYSQTGTCPDSSTITKFTKLMDIQFAKEYEGCTLKTEAIFLGTGNGGYKIPSRYKKLVIFRAYPEGQKPENNALTGQPVGNFCFIDKSKSDLIFNLKSGDKILLKGKVEITGSIGYRQTNFIVEQLSKY